MSGDDNDDGPDLVTWLMLAALGVLALVIIVFFWPLPQGD